MLVFILTFLAVTNLLAVIDSFTTGQLSWSVSYVRVYPHNICQFTTSSGVG